MNSTASFIETKNSLSKGKTGAVKTALRKATISSYEKIKNYKKTTKVFERIAD
jgi:hypothetical protein